MNRKPKKDLYAGVKDGYLSIEVTTCCNSLCLHCFARSGKSIPLSLSIDLAKKIIAEGYNIGYRQLHITGGEPLLWERLFESLHYAFGIGYETVFLNTNGTLLNKKMSGKLSTFRDLSISVSLEGTKAFHDYFRGKGSHRKTSQGIINALSAGVELHIFTLMTRSLLPNLPYFAEEIYEKFPSISSITLITLARVQDNIASLHKELLAPEHFLNLVRTVALLNIYGLRTFVLNDPLINVASKLLKIPWIPQSRALKHKGNMIVRANRNISPSHSSRDNFGKYAPGMIQNVLASEAYRKSTDPDRTICFSCKYIDRCRENGLLQPSEYEWKIKTVEPYCRLVLNRIMP